MSVNEPSDELHALIKGIITQDANIDAILSDIERILSTANSNSKQKVAETQLGLYYPIKYIFGQDSIKSGIPIYLEELYHRIIRRRDLIEPTDEEKKEDAKARQQFIEDYDLDDDISDDEFLGIGPFTDYPDDRSGTPLYLAFLCLEIYIYSRIWSFTISTFHASIINYCKIMGKLMELMYTYNVPFDIGMGQLPSHQDEMDQPHPQNIQESSILIRLIYLKQHMVREVKLYPPEKKEKALEVLTEIDKLFPPFFKPLKPDTGYVPTNLRFIDENNNSVIYSAIDVGNVPLIKLTFEAVKTRYDENLFTSLDSYEESPLSYMIQFLKIEQYTEIIDFLKTIGITLDANVTIHGKSPLWGVLQQGNDPFIQLFIREGMPLSHEFLIKHKEVEEKVEEYTKQLDALLKNSKKIKNNALTARRVVTQEEQTQLTDLRTQTDALEKQIDTERESLVPLLREMTELFISVFAHPMSYDSDEQKERKKKNIYSLLNSVEVHHTLTQKEYDDIRDAIIKQFPEGEGYGAAEGPLLYLHKHNYKMEDDEFGGVELSFFSNYITDHLKDTDKSNLKCLVDACDQPLSGAEISALVAPELWEKFLIPADVSITLNDSLPLYNMILTNTPKPDPAGFGTIHEKSVCPFCLQLESRDSGCIYMTHTKNPKLDSPYCQSHFIVKEISDKYSNKGAELFRAAGKKIDKSNSLQFCIECGRPCWAHLHFTLDGLGFENPVMSQEGFFDNGKCSGGGMVEKVARALAIRDIYSSGTYRDPKEERRMAALAADKAPLEPEYMARAKAIVEMPMNDRKWNKNLVKHTYGKNWNSDDEKNGPPPAPQQGGRGHRDGRKTKQKKRKQTRTKKQKKQKYKRIPLKHTIKKRSAPPIHYKRKHTRRT